MALHLSPPSTSHQPAHPSSLWQPCFLDSGVGPTTQPLIPFSQRHRKQFYCAHLPACELQRCWGRDGEGKHADPGGEAPPCPRSLRLDSLYASYPCKQMTAALLQESCNCVCNNPKTQLCVIYSRIKALKELKSFASEMLKPEKSRL